MCRFFSSVIFQDFKNFESSKVNQGGKYENQEWVMLCSQAKGSSARTLTAIISTARKSKPPLQSAEGRFDSSSSSHGRKRHSVASKVQGFLQWLMSGAEWRHEDSWPHSRDSPHHQTTCQCQKTHFWGVSANPCSAWTFARPHMYGFICVWKS